MTEYIGDFLHYGTIALTVGINSIGVGLGEGLTSRAALKAIDIQPSAQNDIARVAILGTALIETSAIMGVTIAFYLLLGSKGASQALPSSIAEVGIALAICLSGLVIGLASSFPAREACMAIARQPFFADKILRFMLITQSIIQTPIIFGFIIAIFIRTQAANISTIPEALTLVASGLCIGLGSIGPAIGLAVFAKHACRGLGINRNAYNNLMSFTFISQAIIETPMIFALLVSLMLIILPSTPTMLSGIAFIGAAFCMGIGTLGPGIASGRTASAACHQIALKPELYSSISKVSMFAQGLIDTCAIYTFLIAISLILLT
jgi:F0F1-type ATP synthase membrane subunit c/vacuolar-type H+-ATPase subunit K